MKNPTEFPAKALAFADDYGMLPAGTTVLCALSGGADSMALLTCLAALAPSRGLTIRAAHYNHQLRGAESQRDQDFVRDWCERQGIPLTIGHGDVAAQAARTGRGVEETARAMRYAFLDALADDLGADAIATAHNADDNAETLLLHLVRGTGLDGLTGIPPRRGKLIRPLLALTRADIEAYLASEGVPYVVDSTNADVTYARNRIRHEVMPVLRDLNPNFSPRLTANLRHIREDRTLLEGLARTAQVPREEADGLSLLAKDLTDLPRPVAVRAVKQTLAQLGRHQIIAVHLDQVLDLAAGDDPSARLDLPQGLTVRRAYEKLVFSLGQPQAPALEPRTIPGPGRYDLGRWQMELTPVLCPEEPEQGPYRMFLQPADFPLTVRPRQTGDRLRLPGRNTKTLKKWYIDWKIPRQDRDSLPVLVDSCGLLAAAGLGPQEDRRAVPGTPALAVTFQTKDVTPFEQD